jgi:iron only hydrogenase large subunit-like protein
MFSSAVVLTDLNDFIAPSQECIKPIESSKSNGKSTNVKLDEEGEYYEVEIDGKETKLEAASITLNDCLACSGCITSAEAILIATQSHSELLQVIKRNQEFINVN